MMPLDCPSEVASIARASGETARDTGLVEWLETDGVGGYASGTLQAQAARRYHGLLVAPLPGTTRRHVFLSGFGEQRHDVSREVRMVRGRHAVLVRFECQQAATLELRPRLPYREADALTIQNDVLDPEAHPIERGIRCRPYAALPELSLTCSREFAFQAEPDWRLGVRFRLDEARGYGGHEDQFSPGVLRVDLPAGGAVVLAATTGAAIGDPAAAWETEEARRAQLSTNPWERAADDFLYHTPEGRLGVIAGYPWFGEWGRDTFLALPGLTLARGRLELCAEGLRGALPFLNKGMLPNIFGTGVPDSHYGSADAALWFARATLLYQRAGGDEQLIRSDLQPAIESIAEAYFAGSELGLHVDNAGLLHAGAPDLNPTWMDAQTSAGPVTPRHGCPVEIAALWCSLLAQLAELATTRKGRQHWKDKSARARSAFKSRFWLESEGRLADVWRDGDVDRAVRPNMVLAAALEFAPLTLKQRRSIVGVATEELLTPRGLRTLSPRDPAYVARYAGGSEERDSGYHQGTVWPWLIGAYVEASLRAWKPTKKRTAELQALLEGFAPELERAGAGHLSEVFDGDAPHTPGGCIAQAWSTAEFLRARRMLAEGHA